MTIWFHNFWGRISFSLANSSQVTTRAARSFLQYFQCTDLALHRKSKQNTQIYTLHIPIHMVTLHLLLRTWPNLARQISPWLVNLIQLIFWAIGAIFCMILFHSQFLSTQILSLLSLVGNNLSNTVELNLLLKLRNLRPQAFKSPKLKL